ncbi:hypothetical protein NL676_001344 [Syzygium grande]|nr:hypothetical protein NL676_001344 [Syzygium grande]
MRLLLLVRGKFLLMIRGTWWRSLNNHRRRRARAHLSERHPHRPGDVGEGCARSSSAARPGREGRACSSEPLPRSGEGEPASPKVLTNAGARASEATLEPPPSPGSARAVFAEQALARIGSGCPRGSVSTALALGDGEARASTPSPIWGRATAAS